MLQEEITNKRVGIIGGGQLGKMMILEAKKMDFEVIILDPSSDCPASSIADQQIVAQFDDQQAIKQLADQSDVVTYEFEHINVEILKRLEKQGYQTYPTPTSLEVIQDKYQQKKKLFTADLPVPEFKKVSTVKEIKEVADQFGYPVMLKSCTGGYDGKGNALINEEAEVESAYQELGEGQQPLMAEQFIPFTKEISVIICRDTAGKRVVYPIAENEHQNSILIETKVPAQITEEVKKEAIELARQVIDVFAGVGIFCIEMFTTENGEVLINEIAPRPHNSGHYSIEGGITSQFEQHIRAITGLPLGPTTLLRPIVMRNLLGGKQEGQAVVDGIEDALQVPETKVHIYGKQESYYERKMGHLTVMADDVEQAAERASKAESLIQIRGSN
ncbi:5-(carboxyamino)imidazole ribonucleotide synthase [Natroniella sulfidigena]|uniref:5-(carboxyamino)imidazole ribonucleotide synthase n=1 Tax=Natroniella sulfidigena TaxID=723921 RepID=UPI00200AAA08|nr:5-(carboxyamino)imidazole ribonucleotide synthase [Natroniella sulfidigena]MCK8816663.1 5-(carboxyamino)imidazole ribonucleotide synthase [Natroniella sulfidigena]